MKREKHYRIAVVEATALLVCSVVFAASYNHLSGKGIPWIASERIVPYAADTTLTEDIALPAVDINAGAQSSGPQRVTLAQAYKLHTNRKAIFLDAREEERYGAGHIAGAMHFPYYQREKWDQLLKNISPKSTIVTYCDDDCDSSSKLGETLYELGYRRIYVLEVGYDSWRNAGYPVTVGQ
ncbi:MAG: rhodanese-like domain-containing protein [candidate division KSB1 bacterium]|nr:rhodanese-like domain-containing protein [candidate division KSB1 bacterium]MDZ7302938.1 rhodanese-like domain-containing protein [candidate division KSB1 bacterium]MDZ7312214.1 rhodanese-like domain-containing protein [candidate division KSB1 bacterium]